MRRQGGFFYWEKIIMILAIIGAGFFCGEKVWASGSILISEVQITGGAGKTGNDFIEIYNHNNYEFNLKGYRLVKRTKTGATDTSIKSWTTDTFIPANGYFLWANSGYTDIAVTADATTTATISDDNGIAIRFGAADSGTIIDSLAWGNAQNAFIEGTVFPINPGANQSLERKANLDTNNNSADFFIQANPNPQNSDSVILPPSAQCGNGQAESGEQCDDGNSASGDGCSSTCQAESGNPPNPLYQGGETASSTDQNTTPLNPPLSEGTAQGGIKVNFGDVLINELVSDPGDNDVEWIELYNKLNKEIDLTGWWLEDGLKAKTSLSGVIGASGSERFKVIEKPNGNLNNGGDLIALLDGSAKIIDQAAYGNWADGTLDDNALAAPDPKSLARKIDGYNTYNNFNDFAATLKPTKGASNIIQTEDEVSLEARAKYDYSEDIVMTEIMPNPLGDDGKLEFIEIYNAGKRTVDLTGWSLSNEDGQKENLENMATSTKIQAGEYLAVFRPKTKIVLHNDSGEVRLYQPLANKPVRSVKYNNVKEGWSYNITPLNPPLSGGSWTWSETPTPGTANLFKPANQAPEAEFSFKSPALVNTPVNFDSSDTTDQDGDKLAYFWDFGDGFKNNLANPEHTYFKIGIYKIKLEADDGKAVGKQEKSVQVVDNMVDAIDAGEAVKVLDSRLRGNDKIEEPFRNDNLVINEILPNPKGADTGAEWLEILNQSPNKINLINWRVENSNGKYEFKNELPVEAGAFYVLNNVVSKLAFKNTADAINLYNDLDELADTVEYADAVAGETYARGANGSWFWTTRATPGQENVISVADSALTSSFSKATAGKSVDGSVKEYVETDLEKVRELEVGSLVKVKGTVAVEPGILGAQIFYIVGSPGLQIYNYQKEFPLLRVGDYVEVAGELALSQGELRIKTKDKTDIKIDEHKPAPVALAISSDQVNEDMTGRLITISGEITDKKSSTLYLDDGNDEILVYIKKNTGISTKGLSAGQQAAITGILSKTNAGLRLLPRYQSDIVKIEAVAELEPQVLGEVATAKEWDLAQRDKKMELFKYLLIIAGGVIIVLGVLFIKTRMKIP